MTQRFLTLFKPFWSSILLLSIASIVFLIQKWCVNPYFFKLYYYVIAKPSGFVRKKKSKESINYYYLILFSNESTWYYKEFDWKLISIMDVNLAPDGDCALKLPPPFKTISHSSNNQSLITKRTGASPSFWEMYTWEPLERIFIFIDFTVKTV